MTVPTLSTSSEALLSLDADVLVIGVRSTDDGPRLLTDERSLLALESTLPSIGITGSPDELRRLSLPEGAARSLALVGLGSVSATPDTNELRYASGSAARQLTGVESIVIGLPATSDAHVLAILEGAGIGAYAYNEHRSTPPKNLPATSITVASAFGADAAERATIVARAVHTVRDLVNSPPSHLYPQTLADAVVALGADGPVSIEVLAEAELQAGGFGGILGVGQGSPRGPRLAKLSYSPEGASRHLALVGKGITFDSGGLSLKPPTGMIGMKYDMTGSATIAAVVLAAAELGLPVRLTGFMCLAENMPSGTAARPGDVLTIRGGKTVEYLNTDAEGRLVLADGLVAASELEPDAIVDVATLTGAARVALGNRYTGAMGDEDLVRRVTELAAEVGEPFWPMPLPAELRPMLNSDIADIQNIKPGNTAAGMLIAAVFLREFVGTVGDGDEKRVIPWAHLDIAGPANNEGGGYGYTVKGSTGVTVRALLALAEDFSRA